MYQSGRTGVSDVKIVATSGARGKRTLTKGKSLAPTARVLMFAKTGKFGGSKDLNVMIATPTFS